MSMCYVNLVCANHQEAQMIARHLLEKRLIACAKRLEVASTYRWQGDIVDDKEVLLIMETTPDHFRNIESVVAKLHSYDTFVLTRTPIDIANGAAEEWLAGSLFVIDKSGKNSKQGR